MKNKKNFTLHYIVGVVLLLVFFALLLLSNGSNTTASYNFFSNVNQENGDYYGKEVIIGELTLSNIGFLPSRKEVTRYIVCDFDSEYDISSSYVRYRGKVLSRSEDIFTNYYYENQFVDLSPREEIVMDIVVSTGMPRKGEFGTYPYSNITGDIEFSVLELDPDKQYYWEYDMCEGYSKENREYTVVVTFE